MVRVDTYKGVKPHVALSIETETLDRKNSIYFKILEKTKLLHLLYADLLSVKKMQKPDKIYLDNPNLLYALASHPVKIGTARETFVVNQLSCDHEIEQKEDRRF